MMQTYWSDGFESHSDGYIPDGWTLRNGYSGIAQADSSYASSGSVSYRFSDSNSIGYTQATDNFTTVSEATAVSATESQTIDFQFDYREVSTGQGGLGVWATDPTGNVIFAVGTTNPDAVYRENGAENTLVAGPSYEEWHRFSVTVDPSAGTYDATWETLTGSTSSASRTQVAFEDSAASGHVDTIHYGCFGSGMNGNFHNWVDNFSLTHYFPAAPSGLSADTVTDTTADLSYTINDGTVNDHVLLATSHEPLTRDSSHWTFNGAASIESYWPYYGSSHVYINDPDGQSGPLATATPHPGGAQVDRFEFLYRENSGSSGGGIRLANSNGNYELGLMTDNPQWCIDDANGPSQRYDPGIPYDSWARARAVFDWGASEVSIEYSHPDGTGIRYRETVPLKQSVDIETVEIWDYTGGTWGNSSVQMSMDGMATYDEVATLSASESTYTLQNLNHGEKYWTMVEARTDYVTRRHE